MAKIISIFILQFNIKYIYLQYKIKKDYIMANCNSLFQSFNGELEILSSKKDKMRTSRENLREQIRDHFTEKHPAYYPSFFIQGSYKLGTCIRTKDDHCDMDDGVYFKSNPENVTGATLQNWVMDAVEGTTNASPIHKNKCIRVDYKAGYNIDLPVMVFDENVDCHPKLAMRDGDFREDDPKEFVDYYKNKKSPQMNRLVRYLKAWCDNVRDSMPSGLSMTVLTLKHFQSNGRDDVALKFLLVEMEKSLNVFFACYMPTTPRDNLFYGYSDTKKQKFMDRLHDFVVDAKTAIDEPNQLKASKLWRKHLGERFPLGEDKDEDRETTASNVRPVIGNSSPYYG